MKKRMGQGSEGASGRIEQNNPVSPAALAPAGQDSSSSKQVAKEAGNPSTSW